MQNSILGASPWKMCWENTGQTMRSSFKGYCFLVRQLLFFFLYSFFLFPEKGVPSLHTSRSSFYLPRFASLSNQVLYESNGSSRENRLLPANSNVHTQVKFWLNDYLLCNCNCNCKRNIRLEGRKSLFLCQINRTFSGTTFSMYKKSGLLIPWWFPLKTILQNGSYAIFSNALVYNATLYYPNHYAGRKCTKLKASTCQVTSATLYRLA